MSQDIIDGYLDLLSGVGSHALQTAWFRSHARWWQAAPLPADVERGERRACYRNAALLAAERPELTYVEGYAVPPELPIPIEHAWCVDREGMVVDPTWKSPELATYYGVPFDTRWLWSQLEEREHFGLIFDRNILPMMGDDSSWRADVP